MAAVTIRELLTKLGVDADTAAVQQYDKAIGQAKTAMLAAAAAAAAMTAALVGATVATAAQGDEAAKAGARVGASAEEMQELGFAAEQTGASLKDVENVLKVQARTSDEARQGLAASAEAYERLGVKAEDATGKAKPQVQLLKELADGFRNRLTTDAERAAVAQDVFGRSGVKLLPLLKQGSEGIEELTAQAQDLGFVLDNEAAKAAEDFTDRQNEVRKALIGVRNQIGKRLLPVFTDMLAGFRDFIVVNRDVIRQRIDKNMERITTAIGFLRRGFQKVDEVVRERLGGWGNIFQQIEKAAAFTGLLGALTVVIRLAKAASLALGAMSMAGAPVALAMGAVALAVVGAALAIEDLIVFARGGESAIGQFLAAFDPQLAEELRLTLNEVGAEIGVLTDEIEVALGALGELLGVFGDVEDIGASFLLGVIRKLNDDLQIMVGWLQIATELIKAVTGGESDVLGTINRLRGEFIDRAQERGRQQFAEMVMGQVGAGEAAAAAGVPFVNGGNTTVTQGGDTITMNITGASQGEIENFVESQRVKRNRRLMAAVAGGER